MLIYTYALELNISLTCACLIGQDGVNNLLAQHETKVAQAASAASTEDAPGSSPLSHATTAATGSRRSGDKRTKRVQAGSEPGRLGILRKKLVDFLRSSKCYKPSGMLSWFPRDELLEERAILLSHINQHTQALMIYAHKLHDPLIAERHCDEHYNPNSKDTKFIYLDLLRVFLRPAAELKAEPMVKAALDLLTRHHARIPAAEALALLPPNTSISELLPFFSAVLTSSKHTRRNNQVVRNLLAAEHMQVHQRNLNVGQPRVLIDVASVCARCRKKIGSSAFARLPDGVVMHYICCTLHNNSNH